jgi:hypothetical protein
MRGDRLTVQGSCSQVVALAMCYSSGIQYLDEIASTLHKASICRARYLSKCMSTIEKTSSCLKTSTREASCNCSTG